MAASRRGRSPTATRAPSSGSVPSPSPGGDGGGPRTPLLGRGRLTLSAQETRDLNAFIDAILAEDEEEDGDNFSPAGAELTVVDSSPVCLPSGRFGSPGPSFRSRSPSASARSPGIGRFGSPGPSFRSRSPSASARSPGISARGPRPAYADAMRLDLSQLSGRKGYGHDDELDTSMATVRAMSEGRIKVLCSVQGSERHRAMLLRPESATYALFRAQVLKKVGVAGGELFYVDSDGDKIEVDDDDSLSAFMDTANAGKCKIVVVPDGCGQRSARTLSPPPVLPAAPTPQPAGAGSQPAPAPASGDSPSPPRVPPDYVTINKATRERLGVTWHDHTVLRSVQEGTPAAKAGCQQFIGRRAVAVNGRPVERLCDIRAAIDGQSMVTVCFSPQVVAAPAMMTARDQGDGQRRVTGSTSSNSPPSAEYCSSEPVVVLHGHNGPVYACALSADGSFCVTGGRDRKLRIWITRTGQQGQVLLGHSDFVLAVDVARDGRALCSGGGDKRGILWTRDRGDAGFSLRYQLTGHTNRVYDVKFAPDSRTVATGSCDATVRLWDVLSGVTTRVLQGHTDGVLAVSFGEAAGSHQLASAGDDTQIILWNWKTGDQVGPLSRQGQGHVKTVWSCRFSPDDQLLVTAALAPEILVWDVPSRSVLRTLVGHQDAAVHRVVFCSRRRLISCGRDHKVVLWDLSAPEERKMLKQLTTHKNVVYCVAAANGVVASSSADQTCAIWAVPMPSTEM